LEEKLEEPLPAPQNGSEYLEKTAQNFRNPQDQILERVKAYQTLPLVYHNLRRLGLPASQLQLAGSWRGLSPPINSVVRFVRKN